MFDSLCGIWDSHTKMCIRLRIHNDLEKNTSITHPSPPCLHQPNCDLAKVLSAPTSTLANGNRALLVTMPENPEDSNIRMAADGYANLAKDVHSAPACFITWEVHLTKGVFSPRSTSRNCGDTFSGVERIYEVSGVQTPKLQLKVYQYSIYCRMYVYTVDTVPFLAKTKPMEQLNQTPTKKNKKTSQKNDHGNFHWKKMFPTPKKKRAPPATPNGRPSTYQPNRQASKEQGHPTTTGGS